MTEQFDKLEKRTLDIDVLEAALERIDIIHSQYDTIYVSFSGGKDSLVMLKLVELYRKIKGIKEKINVYFYDEEIIPTDVISFITKIYNSGKYNFDWWCLQMESEIYILGNKDKYIQWDENRQHIRKKPEWSLTAPGVHTQYTATNILAKNPKGRTAVLLGIRANESLNRLISMYKGTNNHPWMVKQEQNIFLCKPIYDWSEKDIFKFLYDYKIEYCKSYDNQIFNGDALRVSTPLHAESAKTMLMKLKTNDPIFFNQIMQVFPEIDMHVRYFKSIKKGKSDFSNYEPTWDGLIKFAREKVPNDELQDKLIKEVMRCKARRELNENKKPFGGYPLLYLFQEIQDGRYKRFLAPIMYSDVKKEHYEFEGKVYPGN